MEIELKHLLLKIGNLKGHYDLARNEQEKFNIFSVMHRVHDERRLHSRFLAVLLNPFGSHGMKDLFLKNFFKIFPNLEFSNFQNAVVYPHEENKAEHRNIDILIIDRTSKNAIIIENKIYAGDSNNEDGGQLERYYKFIRDHEKIPESNIRVFYLTLDKHSPSERSLGEFKTLERMNGMCISYEEHVLNWLKDCLTSVYDKPFVRESILQYEKLLKSMTSNETEVAERIKLKEIIGENVVNMETTKYLIDNFKHVMWHTIADFWDELERELKQNGFEIVNTIDKKSITHMTHFQTNKTQEEGGIVFRIKEGINGTLRHEKDDYFFWGFAKVAIAEGQKQIMEVLEKDGLLIGIGAYWWRELTFENGERLHLKDFSQTNTFNLINPEKMKETVRKIVSDVIFIQGELNKRVLG